MTFVRLSILAVIVMLATPAFSNCSGIVTRPRTAELEYVFEAGERNSPNAVTKGEGG
jgi:hypothetical protein